MPFLVNSYIIKLHANLNVKIQKQLSLAHNHDQMNLHYLGSMSITYGSQSFVTMPVYVFMTQKIQSTIPFHQTCKLSTNHLYLALAEHIPSYKTQ
jgi:hypothetical protein